MSTGADCRFIEVAPGRWQYRLQEWPYGDNDQYETSRVFPSFTAALEDLDQNHANPGGWSTTLHPDHRHEWTVQEGAQVPAGVEVTIRIKSLGQDPTKEAILELLQSGGISTDHLRVRAASEWDMSARIRTCEACGESKT